MEPKILTTEQLDKLAVFRDSLKERLAIYVADELLKSHRAASALIEELQSELKAERERAEDYDY